MAMVRASVDEIDLALVALFAERQHYIEAAARIKKCREEIRDAKRIEDVLSKVTTRARDFGLSELIAEPVWRTLIECSIAHELVEWDRLHPPQETFVAMSGRDSPAEA